MGTAVYHVHADWDPEADVWVATSDDVPGLATEAPTIEALTEKLRNLIPELLEANHLLSGNQPQAISRHTANAVLKQAGIEKQF